MSDPEGPMVLASTKLPPLLAAKLERLARESRRSKSQVLRLLVEQALLSDLGVHLQARPYPSQTEEVLQ